MNIDLATFDQQKYPRYGNANPERMAMPFWERMVQNRASAHWARTHFNATYQDTPDPVWCFDRFGMSETVLADGRTVYVGGEHEDFYDPDFFIYNDVVVVDLDGEIDIYGYPKDVFPPTDFHSATPVENYLWIIGCLGYLEERQPGVTPVYRLDYQSFQIEQIHTSGRNPGWISGHQAVYDAENTRIVLTDGHRFEWNAQQQIYHAVQDIFWLDLPTLSWHLV